MQFLTFLYPQLEDLISRNISPATFDPFLRAKKTASVETEAVHPQTLNKIVKVISQEFVQAKGLIRFPYEVPRTSKIRHTRPPYSWAVPPTHLPEHVRLRDHVNAPCEAAGLMAPRVDPARVTNPCREVQNSRALPGHFKGDERGTRSMLTENSNQNPHEIRLFSIFFPSPYQRLLRRCARAITAYLRAAKRYPRKCWAKPLSAG